MHKQSGVAIFVLYLAQLAFGASIHYYKPKAWAKGQGRRPYQNYFHAVTGLLIIALAMFQVRAVFTVSLELRGGTRPRASAAHYPAGARFAFRPSTFFYDPHPFRS